MVGNNRNDYKHSILTVYLTLSATLAAIVASPSRASAGNYTFTNIADNTSGQFGNFHYRVTINNSGTVAFLASYDPPSMFTGLIDNGGIYTGNGGPLTTIADTTGEQFLGFPRGPDINDAGTVAFAGIGYEGFYFTGNGGPVTPILPTDVNFYSLGFHAEINNHGTLVFWAKPIDDVLGYVRGIYTGDGGPLTAMALESPYGPFSSLFAENSARPSINDNGTVAFLGDLIPEDTTVSSVRGIYTVATPGGPFTTIADSSGPFSSFSTNPHINNSGTVAFRAQRDVGGPGIFTGDGTTITTIADTSGPFSTFSNIGFFAINNHGTVAFQASLDAGGNGIFTGPDVVADKVIQTGDPLFGSTVLSVVMSDGLNDHGDIAFLYVLDNNVRGVAVAHFIPEPASIALLICASLTLGSRKMWVKTKNGSRWIFVPLCPSLPPLGRLIPSVRKSVFCDTSVPVYPPWRAQTRRFPLTARPRGQGTRDIG